MRKIVALTIIVAGAALALAADAKRVDTNSLVGKAAPQFSLSTADDKTMSLSDEKGKVVLLDFWATWCPPCRASLPHLQKIYDDADLKEKGLRVYAVNQREGKEKAADYCKENKLTFPVALDKEGSAGESYLVQGIPTTVVIGRDQKVKNVFIGFGPGLEEKVRSAVESALSEK